MMSPKCLLGKRIVHKTSGTTQDQESRSVVAKTMLNFGSIQVKRKGKIDNWICDIVFVSLQKSFLQRISGCHIVFCLF